MKPRQHRTRGIILSRTDFGEADRILTLITPDKGKIKAIAKGVRRQKSKLAGGIELFSVSDISYVVGKGDISTLTSTRLIKHYGKIVKDLDRTNAGYEMIKLVSKNTEENAEEAYFNLLEEAFQALDDAQIGLDLINSWFRARLLAYAGHTPNLRSDTEGRPLEESKSYDFNIDSMTFQEAKNRQGKFTKDEIKFLRLLFNDNRPQVLQKVQGAEPLSAFCAPLLVSMVRGF
jgi:DNA repair protein RecO (recombination protein O)